MTRFGRGVDPDADAPEWWRRSAALRRVPVVAAIVIAFLIVRAFSGSTPPPLRTSCTTPAFALSTYSTAPHHTVQWSATGPPRSRFALTVGATGLRSADGHLTAQPEAGMGSTRALIAGPRSFSDGCTANGSFGLPLPARSYSVRMFTLPPSGQPREVAHKTLKVTP